MQPPWRRRGGRRAQCFARRAGRVGGVRWKRFLAPRARHFACGWAQVDLVILRLVSWHSGRSAVQPASAPVMCEARAGGAARRDRQAGADAQGRPHALVPTPCPTRRETEGSAVVEGAASWGSWNAPVPMPMPKAELLPRQARLRKDRVGRVRGATGRASRVERDGVADHRIGQGKVWKRAGGMGRAGRGRRDAPPRLAGQRTLARSVLPGSEVISRILESAHARRSAAV